MKRIFPISIIIALVMTLLMSVPAGAAGFVFLRELDSVSIASENGEARSFPEGRIESFNASNPDGFDYPTGAMTWAADDDDPAGYVRLLALSGQPQAVRIMHLDGGADDGFAVFVRDARFRWQKVGVYLDAEEDSLKWHWDTFSITRNTMGRLIALPRTRIINIKIVPTGEEWEGFDDWGQLQIAWVGLLGR